MKFLLLEENRKNERSSMRPCFVLFEVVVSHLSHFYEYFQFCRRKWIGKTGTGGR